MALQNGWAMDVNLKSHPHGDDFRWIRTGSCAFRPFCHTETASWVPEDAYLWNRVPECKNLNTPVSHLRGYGWNRINPELMTLQHNLCLNPHAQSAPHLPYDPRRRQRTHARTHARRSHQKSSFGYKKNWILICPQLGQFLTNFKNLNVHIFIEIYIFFSFLWCVDIVSISNATTVRSSVGF